MNHTPLKPAQILEMQRREISSLKNELNEVMRYQWEIEKQRIYWQEKCQKLERLLQPKDQANEH